MHGQYLAPQRVDFEPMLARQVRDRQWAAIACLRCRGPHFSVLVEVRRAGLLRSCVSGLRLECQRPQTVVAIADAVGDLDV